ncbi:FAD/NAD(P)-binding protein [Nonomuraea glycinis]|uniref:Adenylate cyclase n=1 Tax=Nonomuraea glycinis TaxID=2047744 RepID=A0A918A5Q6_9ACTN|nr:FAD/NAD(P)-binding protein [Nonomuraea glycinis]MCA2176258.1 FAD/NAD(P)-binding protein [Nonomuraea glycinis]GGP07532.1 adenylate cyclase [Nonomuraea glycinis]
MTAVVVIGAGPTGTCLLERICGNAPRSPQGRVLDVHVVDPHPPGAGRSWRIDRSLAPRADSAAGDLTVFTDVAGAVPGPSLADWLGREPGYSASRIEVGRYLGDAFERVVRGAPASVRIHAHRATAVGLTESAGTQRVALSTGEHLEAHAVVLAHGRPDVPPAGAETADVVFAARHGLVYLPGGRTAELDLEGVRAGEPVLVRGTGRALCDLAALLTVGRGGRFAEGRQGEPVYLPSGAEPLLYVGSRRGVPHHARPGYRAAGPPPDPPRFLTAATSAGELRQAVAKELAYAYYHELFVRHPARTRTSWDAFEATLTRAEWGGKEIRALITKSVPRFADRLRLDRLERPLHGMRFGDLAGLQRWMHGCLGTDLARRADPAFSADLMMIHGLLAARAVLATEVAADPWFQGLLGPVADGPSLARQAELRALAQAGVVTFLGAEPRVVPDEAAGAWRATSPTVPGSTTARTLIEARGPAPGAGRSTDPLIAGLFAQGACREVSGLLEVCLPDRRLVTRTGAVHDRRFALGSWTVGGLAGFDGPGGAAPLLREADALARTVLAQAAGSRLHAAA